MPLYLPEAKMQIAKPLAHRVTSSLRALRKLTYGMTAHEVVLYATRMRADMEGLFILITIGDLIGLPVLPPYYSLRLLPYLVPQIATWKRHMLRERDILDAGGLDLLG